MRYLCIEMPSNLAQYRNWNLGVDVGLVRLRVHQVGHPLDFARYSDQNVLQHMALVLVGCQGVHVVVTHRIQKAERDACKPHHDLGFSV